MKDMIGLEIHGYLNTKEKLFCTCSNNSEDSKPNTNICPICTGSPGSKPMLPNEQAIAKIIQIALMLGSNINTYQGKVEAISKGKVGKKTVGVLTWQRKHYN